MALPSPFAARGTVPIEKPSSPAWGSFLSPLHNTRQSAATPNPLASNILPPQSYGVASIPPVAPTYPIDPLAVDVSQLTDDAQVKAVLDAVDTEMQQILKYQQMLLQHVSTPAAVSPSTSPSAPASTQRVVQPVITSESVAPHRRTQPDFSSPLSATSPASAISQRGGSVSAISSITSPDDRLQPEIATSYQHYTSHDHLRQRMSARDHLSTASPQVFVSIPLNELPKSSSKKQTMNAPAITRPIHTDTPHVPSEAPIKSPEPLSKVPSTTVVTSSANAEDSDSFYPELIANVSSLAVQLASATHGFAQEKSSSRAAAEQKRKEMLQGLQTLEKSQEQHLTDLETLTTDLLRAAQASLAAKEAQRLQQQMVSQHPRLAAILTDISPSTPPTEKIADVSLQSILDKAAEELRAVTAQAMQSAAAVGLPAVYSMSAASLNVNGSNVEETTNTPSNIADKVKDTPPVTSETVARRAEFFLHRGSAALPTTNVLSSDVPTVSLSLHQAPTAAVPEASLHHTGAGRADSTQLSTTDATQLSHHHNNHGDEPLSLEDLLANEISGIQHDYYADSHTTRQFDPSGGRAPTHAQAHAHLYAESFASSPSGSIRSSPHRNTSALPDVHATPPPQTHLAAAGRLHQPQRTDPSTSIPIVFDPVLNAWVPHSPDIGGYAHKHGAQPPRAATSLAKHAIRQTKAAAVASAHSNATGGVHQQKRAVVGHYSKPTESSRRRSVFE